jgi:hypothetical protein
VVGVFRPRNPGSEEAQGELEALGKAPIDCGMMWFKGQRMGPGQAPVKKDNRALRDLIAGEKAKPSLVVSHALGLDEAPPPTSTSTPVARAGPRSSCIPADAGTATSGFPGVQPGAWRCMRASHRSSSVRGGTGRGRPER